MAEVVKMPKLSDTMTEGVVAKWHKNIGDNVEEGELLAEIETDKATMEFESFQSGVLLYQGVKEGGTAEVESVLAVLGEKGENYETLLKENANQKAATQEKDVQENAHGSIPITTVISIEAPNVNASIIKMPKLSDTMTEGVVAKWHKKVGDTIKSGEVIAEIETDKATMEFEAYEDGTLLFISVGEGQTGIVDSILAIVGDKKADYQALIDYHNAISQNDVVEEKTIAKSESQEIKTAVNIPEPSKVISHTSSSNERIKVSPLAKKFASEKGISLNLIQGSGDGGRIIKKDIEDYNPSGEFSGPLVEKFTDISVSQMRKTIANRLVESKFQAPHFYLTISLNMDQAVEARRAINNQIEGKISFNDMIIKAAAMALKKHQNVNVSWMGDSIRSYEHVHIGVAVAVEDGLLVPVVKHANAKSYVQIGREVKEFAEKAKNKTLQPTDWEGSTFTISNLGMFGIEEFTAIINPPNACILAVGGIELKPVVKNGQIVPGNVMKVTLSCDHRAVDGAKGSDFLNSFKQFLENPITMFI